jgi:hypothetical protein
MLWELVEQQEAGASVGTTERHLVIDLGLLLKKQTKKGLAIEEKRMRTNWNSPHLCIYFSP